jgi:hypothetical protein
VLPVLRAGDDGRARVHSPDLSLGYCPPGYKGTP